MTHKGPGWAVVEGDALDVLAKLPDNRFHSVIQDPPAAIRFMNAAWDSDRGGRKQWTEWLTGIQAEALRVTKPGGWSLTWALPRKSHWTAMAVEDAGWEIRDIVHHLFGTGMGAKGSPKSDRWKGWNACLKPVAEHWILARKPLSEPSISANLERWLTGALHVDACQVGSNAGWSYPNGKGGSPLHGGGFKDIACEATKGRYPPHLVLGHAPGCQVTGTRKVKTGKAYRSKSGGNSFGGDRPKKPQPDLTYADQDGNEVVPVFDCVPGCPVAIIDAQGIVGGMHGAGAKRGGGLGTEANASIFRGQGRPSKSNGTRYGDQGGPSRFWPQFFYTPKASVREKNDGCEDLDPRDWREGTKRSTPRSGQIFDEYGRKGKDRPNSHATVKPVKLMRWLIRLTTHPGGLVLDPFNGSGTTGVAAILEGMRYLGIEGGDDRSPYYCEVSARRIRMAVERRDALERLRREKPRIRRSRS